LRKQRRDSPPASGRQAADGQRQPGRSREGAGEDPVNGDDDPDGSWQRDGNFFTAPPSHWNGTTRANAAPVRRTARQIT